VNPQSPPAETFDRPAVTAVTDGYVEHIGDQRARPPSRRVGRRSSGCCGHIRATTSSADAALGAGLEDAPFQSLSWNRNDLASLEHSVNPPSDLAGEGRIPTRHGHRGRRPRGGGR
jgi:hypothetical protein